MPTTVQEVNRVLSLHRSPITPMAYEQVPYAFWKSGTSIIRGARLTGGLHEGQEAVVATLGGVTRADDGTWNGEVGYNAKLEDERCITVQWDRVDAARLMLHPAI